MIRTSYILLTFMLLASCGSSKSKEAPAAQHTASQSFYFCPDSAYSYIAQQVDFGPRVPGTDAARQCANWIVEKLEEFGASNIATQRATVTAYNGDKLPIANISAQFRPEANERVLLLAHWDTRPWADQEENPSMREKPIDGANDGASGVGVILELARNMAKIDTDYGLDVLFVDAEDYGRRSDQLSADADDSWCLGTQHWIEHPTLDLSKVDFAVLLDMVGGKGAVFPREYHSEYACKKANDIVWQAARRAGQSARFPDKLGGAVVDDHVYLIMAGIPAIDIIESDNPDTGSFPPHWHTHADNLDAIDTATLQAVGQTIEEMFLSL